MRFECAVYLVSTIKRRIDILEGETRMLLERSCKFNYTGVRLAFVFDDTHVYAFMTAIYAAVFKADYTHKVRFFYFLEHLQGAICQFQ